eukprot:3072669-Prymnesium_polylepis.2
MAGPQWHLDVSSDLCVCAGGQLVRPSEERVCADPLRSSESRWVPGEPRAIATEPATVWSCK